MRGIRFSKRDHVAGGPHRLREPSARFPGAASWSGGGVAVGIVAIGINFLSAGIATQVTGMVSVVLYVAYGTTLISALVGAIRNRIPDAPREYFTIGGALKPRCVVGIVWSVVVIACMTFPSGSHIIGYYTLGFEVAAGLWYVLVLRRRLLNGTARMGAVPVKAVQESAVVPEVARDAEEPV